MPNAHSQWKHKLKAKKVKQENRLALIPTLASSMLIFLLSILNFLLLFLLRNDNRHVTGAKRPGCVNFHLILLYLFFIICFLYSIVESYHFLFDLCKKYFSIPRSRVTNHFLRKILRRRHPIFFWFEPCLVTQFRISSTFLMTVSRSIRLLTEPFILEGRPVLSPPSLV